MGCWASKPAESALISLCRCRRHLLRQAIDRRFSLAAAHAAYFRSLKPLADALLIFAQQSAAAADVVPLPPSKKPSAAAGGGEVTGGSSPISGDGSHLHFSDSDTDSPNPNPNPNPKPNYMRSSSMTPNVVYEDEGSHLHISSSDTDFPNPNPNPNHHYVRSSSTTPNVVYEDEGSHLHISSSDDSKTEAKGGNPNPNPKPKHNLKPNYHYMRSSSTTPNVVYEDEGSHLHISSSDDSKTEAKGGNPNPNPNPNPKPKPSLKPNCHYMRSSSTTPNVVYEDPYGGSYEGYVHDPNYYYGLSVSPNPRARVSSPIPPPAGMGSSGWDFLDPFSSYEQFLPGYGAKSVGSGSDLSEVRAREGIPDLEDENEGIVRVRKGKMIDEDFNGIGGGSKSVQAKETTDVLEKKARKVVLTGKGSDGSSSASLVGGGEEKGLSLKKKGVGFEEGKRSSLVSDDGNGDVVEALRNVKEEFRVAVVGSDEVSKLLEVGRMPYRTRNRVFKVISSRILVCVGFRASSRRLFKHRHRLAATTMDRSIKGDYERHVSMKSGPLSSTLEKLHLWEKKLCEEVKAEERLRSIYEKKLRRLKSLDDRGAELQKINATQVALRSVHTKITVAITSVDVISRRMRRIMDEELQPQLVRLIQRLTEMWRLLLGCHQNQLRAIATSKNHNLSIRTSFQDSIPIAAMDLELMLLNWHSSFTGWINSQKSFANSLSSWLSKWFPKNPGPMPDGVIGSPLFILANDWSQAMNRFSEADVKAAIQSFAASMHRLWETQDEELKLHHKSQVLSRDYSNKLNSSKMDHGGRTENTYDDENVAALKRRLDEVRAKHVEIAGQVERVRSASLKTGLIPIFQSLSNFASEILRAHEELGVPNNGGGS